MKFIIEFYADRDGAAPAEEFIRELEPKLQARALRILDLLEMNGTEVRMPYSKHLEDGIFELRVKQGTNAVRVLYFFTIGRKIVLTNGFVKKTQKTPAGMLELAKMYRADYIRRNHR